MTSLLLSLIALSLAAYFAYTLLAMTAAWSWARTKRPVAPDWTPAVTILKPVRGLDAEAFRNFQSFCEQDYPLDRFQIIFCALSSEDPALEAARRLQSEFPQIDVCVVAGEATLEGFNRKVCNMAQALPYAKHDVLILCDSDMRVSSDYLRRVVAPLQNGAALVTCPYRGENPQSMASIWEALGIGADFIPSAMTSRLLEGVGFAFGSTIVLTKRTLAELGGFEAMKDRLADDFFLGNGVQKSGGTAVLSDYVALSVLGRGAFSDMWARRLRWARTLRFCRPAGYAGSYVTHGFSLATLYLALTGFSALGWKVFGGVLAFRLLSASLIALLWTEDPNPLRYLPLLPLSDLLSFALFAFSLCGNRLEWRGERFRIEKGGALAPLKQRNTPAQ